MNTAVGPLTSSMEALGRRVERLANDLANVSTSGHRSQRTAFTLAAGEVAVTEAPDLTPGAVRSTGVETDVALLGSGFLVVEGPEGQPLATRRGDFGVDLAGQLTLEGLPVQGDGGAIARGEGALVVAPDGTVSAGGEELGRLRVVSSNSIGELSGPGLFAIADGAEDLDAAQVEIRQGYLEDSNVDAGRTGAELLISRREYEEAVRAFKLVLDDVLGAAIRDFGRS